jgi:hypothetical protein
MPTLTTVVIIVLGAGICIVALAAIGAVVWMRTREQARDQVLQSAEALAQLDDALDTALTELNKVGGLIQKEINEKYTSMLFLYNLLEEKQKEQIVLPEKIANDLAVAAEVKQKTVEPEPDIITKLPEPKLEVITELPEPVAESTPSAKKKKTPAKKTSPDIEKTENPVAAVSVKPVPRKRTANPKHEKVKELHEKGMSEADIAKELGIGKGEIILILGMVGKK